MRTDAFYASGAGFYMTVSPHHRLFSMLEPGLTGTEQGAIDRFGNVPVVPGICELRHYWPVEIVRIEIFPWTRLQVQGCLIIRNAPEGSIRFK